MAYSPNVEAFLTRLDTDPALKKKVDLAVNNWPGSWENREYLVEDVLLPIAAEEGLPFELADLRKYEMHLKMMRQKDVDISAEEDVEYTYWLLDRGWFNDESIFREVSEDEL